MKCYRDSTRLFGATFRCQPSPSSSGEVTFKSGVVPYIAFISGPRVPRYPLLLPLRIVATAHLASRDHDAPVYPLAGVSSRMSSSSIGGRDLRSQGRVPSLTEKLIGVPNDQTAVGSPYCHNLHKNTVPEIAHCP